jgi:hypothetical protein
VKSRKAEFQGVSEVFPVARLMPLLHGLRLRKLAVR